MKLFKSEENEFYISKKKWKQVLLATSIIILSLYAIAMICSLCGVKYFILNYENPQMSKIEEFLDSYHIAPILQIFVSTIEFSIVLWFILEKRPKWYYIVGRFLLVLLFTIVTPNIPVIFYSFLSLSLYIIFALIENIISNKKLVLKAFLFQLLRLLVAIVITLFLQFIIEIIKSGNFKFENIILSFSNALIYNLEYDIALFVLLLTIRTYYIERKVLIWEIQDGPGGSSQLSMKQSQKLKRKKLSKKTKNRLRWFYTKLYVIQLGAFILVMILPFIFGKVLEFLIMYLCFCVVRYILGFKYSLHYKKEATCVTAGVLIFGLLTLIVPSFQIDLIIGVLLGVGLAILLHLSYKYKAMSLFLDKVGKDRFAELYVIFNGNLEPEYIKKMSNHYGLNEIETNLVIDYMNGEKLIYLAVKYSYSTIYINKLLDKIIEKLNLEQ